MKSKEKYIPPYKVSEEAVNLIAEISAAVERFDIEISGIKGVRLRKTNRIKTIHGSTAIEGNTLTEEQVTAILEGKQVIAPQKEIDEVLCAAAAGSLGVRRAPVAHGQAPGAVPCGWAAAPSLVPILGSMPSVCPRNSAAWL